MLKFSDYTSLTPDKIYHLKGIVERHNFKSESLATFRPLVKKTKKFFLERCSQFFVALQTSDSHCTMSSSKYHV